MGMLAGYMLGSTPHGFLHLFASMLSSELITWPQHRCYHVNWSRDLNIALWRRCTLRWHSSGDFSQSIIKLVKIEWNSNAVLTEAPWIPRTVTDWQFGIYQERTFTWIRENSEKNYRSRMARQMEKEERKSKEETRIKKEQTERRNYYRQNKRTIEL